MDALYLSELRAFLRYVDFPGRRPAIVYLTGLGLAVSGTYHRCVVDPTLGEHRALLADFLGAGFSDAPDAFSYSLEDHAKTVATLLDRLALAQSTVVAYSFGGAVAVTLAATRPDLVAALVLAEPNLDPGGGFLSRRIAAQSEADFRNHGFSRLVADSSARAQDGSRSWAVTSGMLQVASAHGLHRSATGLVGGTRPTMRERLLGLPIPRALIRGETSGPNPREAELVAAGVRLHFVPRAGHGMMWENPEGFVTASKRRLPVGGNQGYSRAGARPPGRDTMIQAKRLGHVVLNVRDAEKSRDFYTQTLGLKVAHENLERGAVFLSFGKEHHDLALFQQATGEPPAKTQPGLHHVAWRLDNFEELKAAYRELKRMGIPLDGTAEHNVTRSVYFLDPDGNRVELYCDMVENGFETMRDVGPKRDPLDLE